MLDAERSFRLENERALKRDVEGKRRGAAAKGIYTSRIADDIFRLIYHEAEYGNYRFAAFAPNRGWVNLRRDGGYASKGLPSEALVKLKELQGASHVAFTPNGGWLFNYGGTGFASHNIPEMRLNKLWEIHNTRNARIQAVAIAPSSGWVIIYKQTIWRTFGSRDEWSVAQEGVPMSCLGALNQTIAAGHLVKQVAFPPSGGWIILYGTNGYTVDGIPTEVGDVLQNLDQRGKIIYNVAFGPNSGWVIVGQSW